MEFQKSFGLFNSLRREEEGEEGKRVRGEKIETRSPHLCSPYMPNLLHHHHPPKTNTSKTTTEVFCPKCLWSATWILTIIISISIASNQVLLGISLDFFTPLTIILSFFLTGALKKVSFVLTKGDIWPHLFVPRDLNNTWLGRQHTTWTTTESKWYT